MMERNGSHPTRGNGTHRGSGSATGAVTPVNRLQALTATGRDVLCVDPSDGRFWELHFTDDHASVIGPLEAASAQVKYGAAPWGQPADSQRVAR